MTDNIYASALKRVVSIFCVMLFLTAAAVNEASDVEFIFAPSIDAIHRSALDPASETKGDELVPALDIIFSYSHKQLYVLGEYSLSEEIQELERLQLGWRSLSGAMVWVGRFHNPITYWNTQYHHGGFIRPTIDAPGIESFEHDGGILSIHDVGILVERLVIPGMNSLTADFSIGAGPILQMHHGLESLDLLNPGRHSEHKLSAAFRLVYGQETPGEDIMGIVFGYNDVSSEIPNVSEVQLSTVGLFGIWEIDDRITLRSSVYAIHDKVRRPTGIEDKGSFVGGYFQGEYEWNNQWTVYGRLEDTSSEGNDPYLVNIEKFITKKQLAGLRFDFSEQQSLRLEFSNTEFQADRFDKVVLQWSAVFP